MAGLCGNVSAMVSPLWRTTFISALGGIFEFYDFVIFALFAPQIGAAFFPQESSASATLKAFAIFAVGYFARPLGGILWAHIADRRGRAYVFSHTVLGMAATTFIIGILPGYATLGIAAPILLVVLRLVQGMALGGEIPSSLCWLSEHAGRRRAGLVTAILLAGVNSGLLLGQTVALIISSVFGDEHVMNWAWRLAFFFGSCIGVLAYFVRRHVGESKEFEKLQSSGQVDPLPLRTLMRKSPRALVSGFLMCSLHAWVVATLYLALPSFLMLACKTTQSHADFIALVSAGCGSLIYVFSGWIADNVSARRFCAWALLAMFVCALPAYASVETSGATWLVALGALSGAFIGAYLGLLPRLFASPVRVSGIAVSYDCAAALIGGSGPFVMFLVAENFGALGVGALFMVFAAGGLVGLALMPKDDNPHLTDTATALYKIS
ncbi:MAG: MFS transporter [Phycisphaerales bacterium]|nr:MFS transporter [Phycisphaerales bacterium]